jgi:hypothetical protein
MYIENKSGENDLIGDARIGRVTFSKTGKSIHYNGKTFQTLSGRGFKANYFDVETGEHYWISGCKRDVYKKAKISVMLSSFRIDGFVKLVNSLKDHCSDSNVDNVELLIKVRVILKYLLEYHRLMI